MLGQLWAWVESQGHWLKSTFHYWERDLVVTSDVLQNSKFFSPSLYPLTWRKFSVGEANEITFYWDLYSGSSFLPPLFYMTSRWFPLFYMTSRWFSGPDLSPEHHTNISKQLMNLFLVFSSKQPASELWLPEKASLCQIIGKYLIDSAWAMCSTRIHHMAKAWPVWNMSLNL